MSVSPAIQPGSPFTETQQSAPPHPRPRLLFVPFPHILLFILPVPERLLLESKNWIHYIMGKLKLQHFGHFIGKDADAGKD